MFSQSNDVVIIRKVARERGCASSEFAGEVLGDIASSADDQNRSPLRQPTRDLTPDSGSGPDDYVNIGVRGRWGCHRCIN
jgi:hypothetical protein